MATRLLQSEQKIASVKTCKGLLERYSTEGDQFFRKPESEQQSLRSEYILPQDNVPVHMSRHVQETIRSLSIKTLFHPFTAQTFAILDVWLFPVMDDMLRGKKPEPREEIGVAITNSLREMSRDS